MTVRFEIAQGQTIPIVQMQHGQVGVVVDSPVGGRVGHLVGRWFQYVADLSDRQQADATNSTGNVRILPPGTKLVLTDNGLALEAPLTDGTIPACELKDFQLAQVAPPLPGDAAVYQPHQLNDLVLRVRDWLMNLSRSARTVGMMEAGSKEFYDTLRVRVLPNGTRLVVEDNE